MRAAVFYLSLKPGHNRTPIHLDGATVYVRAEIAPSGDLLEALDSAAPMEDETIMNSHEIEA